MQDKCILFLMLLAILSFSSSGIYSLEDKTTLRVSATLPLTTTDKADDQGDINRGEDPNSLVTLPTENLEELIKFISEKANAEDNSSANTPYILEGKSFVNSKGERVPIQAKWMKKNPGPENGEENVEEVDELFYMIFTPQ